MRSYHWFITFENPAYFLRTITIACKHHDPRCTRWCITSKRTFSGIEKMVQHDLAQVLKFRVPNEVWIVRPASDAAHHLDKIFVLDHGLGILSLGLPAIDASLEFQGSRVEGTVKAALAIPFIAIGAFLPASEAIHFCRACVRPYALKAIGSREKVQVRSAFRVYRAVCQVTVRLDGRARRSCKREHAERRIETSQEGHDFSIRVAPCCFVCLVNNHEHHFLGITNSSLEVVDDSLRGHEEDALFKPLLSAYSRCRFSCHKYCILPANTDYSIASLHLLSDQWLSRCHKDDLSVCFGRATSVLWKRLRDTMLY
ncbi:hypothetical protein KC320_g64 [Hortaea werneckii]|nr:hypothetical protein KC320_g64 [Hortaea werneckii]